MLSHDASILSTQRQFEWVEKNGKYDSNVHKVYKKNNIIKDHFPCSWGIMTKCTKCN